MYSSLAGRFALVSFVYILANMNASLNASLSYLRIHKVKVRESERFMITVCGAACSILRVLTQWDATLL